MAQIETGRFSSLLRRMLGMAGQVEVSGELSPEISPVLLLEGPTAEWAYLKGLRLSAASAEIGASVGNIGGWRLRNPVDSGAIAVLEGTLFTVDTSSIRVVLTLGQETVDLASIAETTVRDSRWGPSGVTGRNALILSTQALAAPPGQDRGLYNSRMIAAAEAGYEVPVVLMPGDAVDGATVGTNIAIQLSLWWTERALPRLELATG